MKHKKNISLVIIISIIVGMLSIIMPSTMALTPTGNYYQYAYFDVGSSPFLGGQGVGSYGDYIYIDYFGVAHVYQVTIPAGSDPNQHPSNPQATGPMAPRTLTQLTGLTHNMEANIGYSILTSVSEFYVNETGIYFGPMGYPSDTASATTGNIYHWDHSWNYLGAVVSAPKPAIHFQTLAYDPDINTWFTGCVTGREIYTFTPGVDTQWQYEFNYLPGYGGGHHDGLEFVNGYLWISDMTSDYIGQWENIGGTWTEVNLFSYPATPSDVEGMGFGALGHFWVTGWSELYELGGGELQQQLNPLNLHKEDDVSDGECVNIGDIITYTITFENNNPTAVTGVVVKDTLPPEVDFVSSNPYYDSVSDREYTWNIGSLDPGEISSITVTVIVNSFATLGGIIDNEVTIDADGTGSTTVHEYTDVCEEKPVEYPDCWNEPQITTINTHTNVLGCPPGGAPPGQGGSDNLPPYVKVKWEYDEDDIEHDACVDYGLQVAPNLYETRTVGYYAVVTDPNGRETITNVYADVWHPDGTYKYQIELDKISDKQEALKIWDHAFTVHEDLITINEDWALGLPGEVTWWEDVYDELDEQLAYLYRGEAEISYCQPGGWYYVGVRATDHCNLWGDYLCNKFWYIPTSAVAIDFDTVDYSQEGPVAVSYERWIGGDYIFGTSSKPTVRNIGNCPVELWVKQDHMGFADTYGEWNVMFNARLTADGIEAYYYPEQKVQIPGILDLCTEEKLDFSIHVFKGFPNIDYKGTMDLYAEIDDASFIWATPLEFFGEVPYGVPDLPPCWDFP